MIQHKIKFVLSLFFAAALLGACKKQWDQRDSIADQRLDVNLMQQIQANSSLTTFAGYLTKIGYDKVLAASKTYTVWAPTNAALQNIDPAVVADTARLRVFVANHIANQTYLASNIQGGQLRVRTLNGKYVTFTPTTVEDANITVKDQYVKNGSLNIIDKPLTPKMNISEFVRSLTTVGGLQRDYVNGQDTSYTDTSKATVSGLDPKTGKPILVAGTGQVKFNKYFSRVASLDNEDSTYTYIVLTDAAFQAERSKVSKYFTTVTGSVDTTNALAGFNVLKDVAIRGLVKINDLPASLLSVNGVPVPIDKSAIVQTYNASNGIVYVMSSVNFKLADKITPITIQGEKPSFFERPDRGANIINRLRTDNAGIQYRDLLVQFTSSSNSEKAFFAAYKLSNLYTCQYKVYLRAVNDTAYSHIPAPGNISQRIIFGAINGTTTDPTTNVITVTTAVNYPYQNTPPYNYAEMEQTNAAAGTIAPNATINVVGGRLNVTARRSINMYLQGANTATLNQNNVLVDYIRLEPILQ